MGADAVRLFRRSKVRCLIDLVAARSCCCRILGLGLDFILMALAPSVSWLFAGRGSPVSRRRVSVQRVRTSPMCDASDKTGFAFGLMGASFGLRFCLGTGRGGIFGRCRSTLAVWGAAATSLLNACYGFSCCRNRCRSRNGLPFSGDGPIRSVP